jgi:hypothetical protein
VGQAAPPVARAAGAAFLPCPLAPVAVVGPGRGEAGGHRGLPPGAFLAAKLKQHLGAAGVEAHFATHQADHERLRVGMLLGEREDLARELASQVRDEGRDLDAVAAEHGLPVLRRQLLRKELGEALVSALAAAKDGEVVGPVATPQGFALVQIKERHEPVLDPAIRQAIQQELFDRWPADAIREAALDLAVVGTAG